MVVASAAADVGARGSVAAAVAAVVEVVVETPPDNPLRSSQEAARRLSLCLPPALV